jgi:hypothetical protein
MPPSRNLDSNLEEVLEPPVLFKKALKQKGIPETGVFDVCDTGEAGTSKQLRNTRFLKLVRGAIPR